MARDALFNFFLIMEKKWLIGGALLIVAVLAFVLFSEPADDSDAQIEAGNAEISIIKLLGPDCEACFTLGPLVDAIKRTNVSVVGERDVVFGSEESDQLISEHGIERLPTLIVTGEINRSGLSLDRSGDVLVFRDVFAPYARPDGAIEGRVKSTIVFDSACDACYDPSPVLDTLQESGVFVVERERVDAQSSEGRALVEEYSLEILPALLLSEELSAYDAEFVQNWDVVGSVEDGVYVTRQMAPPYYNVSADRIVGKVSLTLVLDESCTGCVNASEFYENTLRSFGVFVEDVARVDMSDPEGRALIDALNITKVPTMVMEGEVQAYPTIVAAWQQVGSQHDRKWVFREVQVSEQPYRDLVKGEIVNQSV